MIKTLETGRIVRLVLTGFVAAVALALFIYWLIQPVDSRDRDRGSMHIETQDGVSCAIWTHNDLAAMACNFDA